MAFDEKESVCLRVQRSPGKYSRNYENFVTLCHACCMIKFYFFFAEASLSPTFLDWHIGIIAVVAGTVFVHNRIRTRSPQDGQFALLALFFGHLVLIFNAFAELTLTLVRLPVIFKQRDILLYPAWAYAIPSIVLKIPISLLEAFVFTVITYFLVGFTPEASRFFKQLLVFFLEHWMATSLFHAIATLSRNFVVAMTAGSMSLLLVLVLGGFIIPRPKIPP